MRSKYVEMEIRGGKFQQYLKISAKQAEDMQNERFFLAKKAIEALNMQNQRKITAPHIPPCNDSQAPLDGGEAFFSGVVHHDGDGDNNCVMLFAGLLPQACCTECQNSSKQKKERPGKEKKGKQEQ